MVQVNIPIFFYFDEIGKIKQLLLKSLILINFKTCMFFGPTSFSFFRSHQNKQKLEHKLVPTTFDSYFSASDDFHFMVIIMWNDGMCSFVVIIEKKLNSETSAKIRVYSLAQN